MSRPHFVGYVGSAGQNHLATVPEPLPVEDGNADNLANAIQADVAAGTLPQISWVVTGSCAASPATRPRPALT